MPNVQPNFFRQGMQSMLPITPGIIPFGAVMGTVCASANLSFLQTVLMNVFVFGGAAQLAAVELMTKHAAVIVVVITGLMINLRFLLYSAAMAPFVRNSSKLVKFFTAHNLTDQSYAVMLANERNFRSDSDAVDFYLGGCVTMNIVWHSSVIAGFIFGNFAPASWSLDFAIPVSFVALLVPTLKNKKYVLVAIFSAVMSVTLINLPYRTGLIATALLAIAFAAAITRRSGVK